MSDNLKNLQSLTNSITTVASPFRNYLNDLHEKYSSLNDGAVADYIPELALSKPEWFGICVVTNDGQIFEVGECDRLFTIQSISKAFVFVRGIKVCQDLSQDFGLHLFNAANSDRNLEEWIAGRDGID